MGYKSEKPQHQHRYRPQGLTNHHHCSIPMNGKELTLQAWSEVKQAVAHAGPCRSTNLSQKVFQTSLSTNEGNEAVEVCKKMEETPPPCGWADSAPTEQCGDRSSIEIIQYKQQTHTVYTGNVQQHSATKWNSSKIAQQWVHFVVLSTAAIHEKRVQERLSVPLRRRQAFLWWLMTKISKHLLWKSDNKFSEVSLKYSVIAQVVFCCFVSYLA